MAIRVLEETGLLPHLNPGVMSWEEMNRLKPVAPSMGMMLETTSTRLFTEKGQAHYGSPDKDPAVRLRVLEDAGRLVGAVHHRHPGRHRRDADRAGRVDLRDPARGPAVRPRAGGHRPELPGQARHRDATRRTTSASTSTSPRSRSRGSCSDRRHAIQAPPNLVDLAECARAARRRRRRLGRRLPADPRPRQPRAAVAVARTAPRRSPRRPGFALAGTADRASGVRPRRRALDRPAGLRHTSPPSPTDDGLARPGVRPEGLPWQEPDGGFAGRRRRRPHRPARLHRHRGPHHRPPRRLRHVYGDWASSRAWPEPGQSPTRWATVLPTPRTARRRMVGTDPASPRPCAPPRATRAT